LRRFVRYIRGQAKFMPKENSRGLKTLASIKNQTCRIPACYRIRKKRAQDRIYLLLRPDGWRNTAGMMIAHAT